MSEQPVESPIPLSREQIKAVQDWAADDRLWSTKATTEFNLYTFARLMLKLAGVAALRREARPRSRAGAGPRTRIETGIYQDRYGFAVVWRDGEAHQREKRFDRSTPIDELRTHRAFMHHARPPRGRFSK